MKNQSKDESADSETLSSGNFWMGIAVIVITGICSIVVFQNGRERYGNFGGLAHFPLFWLAGFTIYPGYICTLLTYTVEPRRDVVLWRNSNVNCCILRRNPLLCVQT